MELLLWINPSLWRAWYRICRLVPLPANSYVFASIPSTGFVRCEDMDLTVEMLERSDPAMLPNVSFSVFPFFPFKKQVARLEDHSPYQSSLEVRVVDGSKNSAGPMNGLRVGEYNEWQLFRRCSERCSGADTIREVNQDIAVAMAFCRCYKCIRWNGICCYGIDQAWATQDRLHLPQEWSVHTQAIAH